MLVNRFTSFLAKKLYGTGGSGSFGSEATRRKGINRSRVIVFNIFMVKIIS
jgi:hypothetical protein